MILSRKWLNEFVDCSAWADHDFSEAMTLSGSKVETFTDLHKNIQNVVAGRIVEMVRHTNSDHMWARRARRLAPARRQGDPCRYAAR